MFQMYKRANYNQNILLTSDLLSNKQMRELQQWWGMNGTWVLRGSHQKISIPLDNRYIDFELTMMPVIV